MKFTLSWLKDHLETTAGLDEIAHRLTMIGLEVEEATDRAATLAPFMVAEVLDVRPHPNADRLKVCRVTTGKETAEVVCGAPNVRTGMKGVFARTGMLIPGTGDVLKKSVIRGVESNGMLCSEREMGLSDEHTGIIELPPDAPLGEPFARVMGLDDPVLDVAVTPDRADCLGVRGIARDLAAAGLGTLKPRPVEPVPAAFESQVGVRFDFPKGKETACPLFIARTIRGVKNGESPEWLRRRLAAVGLRPISALVDITNFLTLDLARPLHVFDAKKLRVGKSGGLTLRFARPGEKLLALDGREYALEDGMTVIADDEGALSLAGIMGGETTGVNEGTTEVVLEVALFDPIRTAATGRRLGIESDARYRFERGLDPLAAFDGAEAATRMIVEICAGEAGSLRVAGDAPRWERTVRYRPERMRTLAGVEVSTAEQKRILVALGFGVNDGEKGPWAVAVPSWRADVEGEADIVEEIARIHGYDRIEPVPLAPETALPRPAWSASHLRADLVRRALAERGLMEAVTWSFMSRAEAELFGFSDDSLRITNPISAELDVMRPSILPNLAAAAQRNADRGLKGAGLFEIGPQYRDPTPEGQALVAAGVRQGPAGPRHWAEAQRAADAFDAKGDALAALETAGIDPETVQIAREAPSWYHPGRSGVIRRGPKQVLAYFGELHPGVLMRMDVEGPMVGFEVFLDAMPAPKAKAGRARPLLKASSLQPVERDFAFVLDREVAAADVVRAAQQADKALVCEVKVFDLYEGQGIGTGKKSLAIAVTLQPTERTLTDEEMEAVGQKIVAAVAKATGGVLRT